MSLMVTEPATSNRPLTHTNLFIPQWPGGSAAVEHAGVTGGEMQFTVTRHTPRHRPPRRVLTPPEEPFPSTGKRLKLDPQTIATPGKYIVLPGA